MSVKISRACQVLLVSVGVGAIATPSSGVELEVNELIGGLKRAIEEAQKTATPPYMTIPWVEGEISYVVKKEGEGSFRMYVVTAEAKYGTESVQRVKFRLEPPAGKQWKVEGPGEIQNAKIAGFDSNAKRVFVTPPGWPEYQVIAIKVGPATRFTDAEGKSKPISAIRVGAEGFLQYKAAPGVEPELVNLKVQATPKPMAPSPIP